MVLLLRSDLKLFFLLKKLIKKKIFFLDFFFNFLKIQRKLGGISESQNSAMVLREVSRGVSLSATELNRRVNLRNEVEFRLCGNFFES